MTPGLKSHESCDTNKPTRDQALAEIVRVGTAILSDYKLTSEYAKRLRAAGREVERKTRHLAHDLPASHNRDCSQPFVTMRCR